MSERASFTTEYIYNEQDYKTIRKMLDKRNYYLFISPPIILDDEVVPIVSGKAGDMFPNQEWSVIEDALDGVETKETIRIIVMCEAGDIVLIKKLPNGIIEKQKL